MKLKWKIIETKEIREDNVFARRVSAHHAGVQEQYVIDKVQLGRDDEGSPLLYHAYMAGYQGLEAYERRRETIIFGDTLQEARDACQKYHDDDVEFMDAAAKFRETSK